MHGARGTATDHAASDRHPVRRLGLGKAEPGAIGAISDRSHRIN